ncbi:MAG: T9SS type A sorting domain-containing protein [Bacteroidia bacterium]
MRIKSIIAIVLFVLVLQNMKAQHLVFEPSLIKEVSLSAKIPALGSNYAYEHKVTRLSIPGQSIHKKSTQNPLLLNNSYNEVNNAANKKASAPNVLNAFEANIFNGYTPPDNAMAVSNNGYIVSSINSNVYYYDTDGSILGFTTFLKLSRDYFDNLSEDLFDPRVLYDQDNNRFIMVILNGHTPEESEVLIFFSQTENPMDGWYGYTIKGDVDDADEWLDYPNISVNKNHLYVSGNMFSSSDRFSQSAIIKIEKSNGFEGKSISYTHWSGIKTSLGNAFTVVPVEKGNRGGYSENAYFVSTEGDFANIIALYTLNTSTGNLEGEELEIPYYDIPNDGEMLNSDQELDMGDARVKNAILINEKIHLVHTTATVNYYAAIGYHQIDLKTKGIETIIMHKDGKKRNLAYPSVGAAGTEYDDQNVFVAYTESGADIYPKLNIINIDENLEQSGEVTLQEGEGSIDILDDDTERWGDYITIANKFNSNTAWVFGCVGNASDQHDNYLIEVSLDQSASVPNTPLKSEVSTYPNPVVEIINLEFELDKRQVVNISLFNMNGQLIELLTKDAFNEGKHLLHFDINQLKKGTYFVKIEGNKGLLAQKQIIK